MNFVLFSVACLINTKNSKIIFQLLLLIVLIVRNLNTLRKRSNLIKMISLQNNYLELILKNLEMLEIKVILKYSKIYRGT
jgi:hypothetical protein